MANTSRASHVVKAVAEVLGREVRNNADEHLGKIRELVIDKLSGKVGYAVLDTGGFMGIGGKYFALPWDSLHFDDEHGCFRVDVDKEKIDHEPGFSKEHWPEIADRTWGEKGTVYYDTTKHHGDTE